MNLLQVAVFWWEVLKPGFYLVIDEYLLFWRGEQVEHYTHRSLFDHSSPRQEVEAGQQVGVAQGSEHFTWGGSHAFWWTIGLAFYIILKESRTFFSGRLASDIFSLLIWSLPKLVVILLIVV